MSISRTLRREQERKNRKTETKVVITQQQPGLVERYYDNLTRKHSSGMALCMYFFFGIYLHDLFNFDAEQLLPLYNAVDNAMAGFQSGDFDEKKLVQELYDKTGIDYRG